MSPDAAPTRYATRSVCRRRTSASCCTARGRGFVRRSRGTSMGEPLHEFEHGYTCKEVVELASEYVEGAMAPDEAVLFELHLNFCDGCYTFVDQVRAAAALAGR